MIRRIFFIFILMMLSPVFAYEDLIISSDGKLTDIKIEDNTVVDICPVVTLMNEKNILMVRPLKEGKTRFCVLKNNKDIVMFNVEVSENETVINNEDGFEIFSLDAPPEGFELDLPPEGVNNG